MTPQTLADVAKLAALGESFDFCLRNFLDNFLPHPTSLALAVEPELLVEKLPDIGNVADAYLAATAEWLAWKFDLPSPVWAFSPARSLHRPWFASQLSALRAVLLLESPAAFRSRNLFVSENALSRA